ncbi:RING finger protein 207 [Heterocephalus glaber]|uniref:RING finger protein 207 n=1 Tax=Heterocephalus glaber TaxID=10181 RepID=G5C568_HETGA|nr:RING finger protein 207 [Heterocephalus glaber]
MSGAIFAPLEGPGAPDPASSHPLVCPLCHVQYERLCLLDCFHDFCAGCLRGRAVDGRLAYPLCRHQTEVKDPSGLPPGDRLLQFLVDSSGHGVEAVHCANCDLECSKQAGWQRAWGAQTAETVYFCNACGQPLCARCRDDTHRARMFASHDIVALGQRSHDVIQKCSECRSRVGTDTGGGGGGPPAALHAEPYILFSTDTKSLLCIRCFRDLQGDAWAHCVDLESAYVQGFERLEQAMRHPVDTLAKREALLLQTVQSQYKEKDKACKEQLCHLATLLPTQQVHPVICSSFLSLANKAEFLDLAHELMGRLQGIFTRPHCLRPEQSSKIASHHRTEFARCLEPLLWPGPRRAGGGAYTLAGGSGLKELPGPSCPLPEEKMSGLPVSKPTPLAEVGDRPFTEHGRRYEDSYRGLQGALQSLKDQVQELPRDLTKHHALIKAEIMGGILGPALELDGRIAWEYACTAGLRAGFREGAAPRGPAPPPLPPDAPGQDGGEEEGGPQLAGSGAPSLRQQEPRRAQLQGLLRLRRENACLTTITRQITPYVRSIAKVKERLEPRFQAPGDKLSENLSLYDDKNGKALAK